MPKKNNFIPALNRRSLTFLYDPLIKMFMPEDHMKRRLLEQTDIQPGDKVLDIGCGTGTLTIMAKKAHPEAQVTGLDPDPEILKIAGNKAKEADTKLHLDEATATDIPYPDRYFNLVISSLMIHHLVTEDKIKALREVYRILIPPGQVHILDFGEPKGRPAKLISLIMQRLEETSDNIKGLLPEMLADAGFVEIQKTFDFMTIFGTMSLYKATRVK